MSRAALLKFIADTTVQVDRRVTQLRADGARDRKAGRALSDPPHRVGSYVWTGWVEGWTGTVAPRREHVGGRLNMTPLEEVQGREAWMRAVGIPEDQISVAVAMVCAGYRPEALGGAH